METEQKQRTIAVLSYGHENAVDAYTLESLGKEVELNVPPENVVMGVVAYNQAVEMQEEGLEPLIVTAGGCAESNKAIIERLNELNETEIKVEANTESNSVASNIKSLKEYTAPYTIICQKFAKLRTWIHSKYHLAEGNFNLLDFETSVRKDQFSKINAKILKEPFP
jgi:hypothetical protein